MLCPKNSWRTYLPPLISTKITILLLLTLLYKLDAMALHL